MLKEDFFVLRLCHPAIKIKTPAGFRDQVDFRIDPQAQRIDFRSRSLFGLFDWAKNRSRMQEFKRRFEHKSRS